MPAKRVTRHLGTVSRSLTAQEICCLCVCRRIGRAGLFFLHPSASYQASAATSLTHSVYPNTGLRLPHSEHCLAMFTPRTRSQRQRFGPKLAPQLPRSSVAAMNWPQQQHNNTSHIQCRKENNSSLTVSLSCSTMLRNRRTHTTHTHALSLTHTPVAEDRYLLVTDAARRRTKVLLLPVSSSDPVQEHLATLRVMVREATYSVLTRLHTPPP